jgi:hypothetical protein
MPEISDTLIELKPDESEADGLVHVQADVSSMYPPTSVPPKFQISGLVVRYGRRFVRLSSLAGSLHMALPRWRRAGRFPRAVLFTLDRDSDRYEYVA